MEKASQGGGKKTKSNKQQTTATATAKADPYGMTSKKSNSKNKNDGNDMKNNGGY